MTKITITNERLLACEWNHLALYYTPGAANPYWGSSPKFTHDVCVATPKDFILAAGVDTFDGMDDETIADEILTLEVDLPE